MNYLGLGLPKSGTSALHAAIKAARNPLCLFEPTRANQDEYLLKCEVEHRLAQVMLPVLDDRAVPPGAFDRTVLIVRDPRDVLVSWLLYRPLLRQGKANPAFIADFLAALRQKEDKGC